ATVMSDGDTIIFRRLLPGKGYIAAAKYRLVVSIGVPEAVDVEINGRLVDLRDPVNQRISRVEVNQANLQSYLDPSFDDLPTSELKSPKQGQTELDTSSKITVNDEGNSAPDSAGQTP
ncbi:MAG TPA: RodZ domain-containing protein, partial [candidate division Zixibacteria bacterium]|nr:RodZ domain-containing protein [candidate division Zixibacteria bacterium]